MCIAYAWTSYDNSSKMYFFEAKFILKHFYRLLIAKWSGNHLPDANS